MRKLQKILILPSNYLAMLRMGMMEKETNSMLLPKLLTK